MNENYLHFLWKTKRLPFHLINTNNGKEITIKHVGFHNNHESGPDFMNGKICIDGLEWCGNIELHVKSSDWYLHKHHYDLAYNNVILHVVYENDRDVFINGSLIPTIELKQFIDWNHFDCFQRFSLGQDEINCAKSLPTIDSIYIESMIERSIVDRLNRKVFFLNQDLTIAEPNQVLYFLLARAFGAKVNQLPFEELTLRLPLSILKKKRKNEQVELVLNASGIFSELESDHFEVNHVAKQSWKRKGLRPPSFPEIRIKQFAVFVSHFDFNLMHFMKSSSDLVIIIDSLFKMASYELDNSLHFSQTFIDLIKINCIVPFLWWYGDVLEDSLLKEKALEILQRIASEKNTIISKWKMHGIKPKSAYESQALIELYNEHCTKNKCLSCEIGVKVLNL